MIEGKFLKLCEQYHNLEVWCQDRLPVRLPIADGEAAGYSYRHAEELAKQVRHELQLGDRPGSGLVNVLGEACGVKVFLMAFEPTGTAASTVSETFGAAVLLNSSNKRWRRNFDLGHELFHLLTWSIFRFADNGASAVPKEFEEKLATCFARNLLMPADAIGTAVNMRMKDGKLSVEALFGIAREFDVSVDALLWHLCLLYRWSDEDTKKEIERARALASLYEEREETLLPPWPARYRALAVEALRRGEMSAGRFAEYLDITRQEAMRYVEQESGGHEEIQVAPA